MRPHRAVLDVSHLPKEAFGPRALSWWGTLGFIAVEGTTLAIAIAAYFYVRQNFVTWPPPGTVEPALLIPTVNVLLILATLAPKHLADRAAHRMDRAGALRWMAVSSVCLLAIVVLRAVEFGALNTRWDDHAYGSVAWGVLAFHSTLLLTDVVETWVLTAILVKGPVEPKHLIAVADDHFYWQFFAPTAVLTYAVVFLSPRFI